MKHLLFLAALCASSASHAQTLPDRSASTSDPVACGIHRYGNAPESAQSLIDHYQRRHKAVLQGWTFDPRVLQTYTRRAYAARAYFGQSPAGRPALFFMPVDTRFQDAAAPDSVYFVEAPDTSVPSPDMMNPQFADRATAVAAIRAQAVSGSAPFSAFLVHPGIVNATSALPEISDVRVYFCDDPEQNGVAAGVLFVATDTAGFPMWGIRSFYQDGTTLTPQQCGSGKPRP